MRWFGVQHHVNLIGLVEPFLEDSSMPRKGLDFLVHGMMIRSSAGVCPLCPSRGWPKGLWFPTGCFSFLCTFNCAVLLYYVCQIGKVQYTTVVEGVQDSLIRAIVAKYRDCIVVTAILDLVFNKQESNPKVVAYFLGLLPHIH